MTALVMQRELDTTNTPPVLLSSKRSPAQPPALPFPLVRPKADRQPAEVERRAHH